MEVQQYVPPADHPLARGVKSCWRLRAHGGFGTEMILPKGNVDLLFNLGSPLILAGPAAHASDVLAPGVWLVGLQTRMFTSRPQGNIHMLGLSLAMEHAAELIPVAMHELTDQRVPASDVLDGTNRLLHEISATADFPAQVRRILDWLGRHQGNAAARVRQVQYACDCLGQTPAGGGLTRIAAALGISSRHLRRMFLEHVGVTPRQYLRLSRFIQALHSITSSRSLTDVAHAANYFDQAHFCHDFRAIAGITPREYQVRVGPAVGHLFLP